MAGHLTEHQDECERRGVHRDQEDEAGGARVFAFVVQGHEEVPRDRHHLPGDQEEHRVPRREEDEHRGDH